MQMAERSVRGFIVHTQSSHMHAQSFQSSRFLTLLSLLIGRAWNLNADSYGLPVNLNYRRHGRSLGRARRWWAAAAAPTLKCALAEHQHKIGRKAYTIACAGYDVNKQAA